jgi:flagellin
LSIENVDPTGLGEYLVDTDQLKNSSSSFFPAAFPSVASSKATLTSKVVEGEDLTIYGNVGNVTIDINGGSSAKEIAAAITARKGESGVYADAQTRMNISFSELASASTDTVSFNLYGKNDTAVLIAANVDFAVTNGRSANLSELAAAINGTSGKTGITASLSVDKATMTLISNDGYDITAENYALVGVTGPTMNVSGADESYANLTDGTTQFSDGSTDFYSPIPITAGTDPDTVSVSGAIKFHSPFVFSIATASQGSDEAPTITPSGTTTGLTASTTSLVVVPDATAGTTVATGGAGTPTGMTIEFRTDGSGGLLTPVRILNMGSGFSYGDVITIPDGILGGTTGGGNDTVITLTTPSGHTLNDAIEVPGGLFSGNPPGATLSSVSQLDVLNVANSLKMLTAVDGALVRIDLERSDLGATMSRMEHTISNLSNIVMNTKAARSRINDADIAAESTELSKAQVLNQAAQAMLAQANKAQQSILQLLN